MSITMIFERPYRHVLNGLLVAAGLALSWPADAAGMTPMAIARYEPLDAMRFSPGAGPADASLTFSALGRRFDLELERNDGLLSDAVRDALPGGLYAYRGKLAGNDESWVRIVVDGGVPSGLIWDGREMLAIEAPGDSAVSSSDPVVFRLDDLSAPPGALSCASPDLSSGDAGSYAGLQDELRLVAAGAATLRLDISAIGDFRFVDSISGDPAAAILTRINNVDGIFSSQVGVQIVLAETEVFTTQGSEPFTNTTAPATLNAELGEYRENTAIHRNQGLTHLFTGRDLDGSTVGNGFQALVCWDYFGAGFTQATFGASTDSLIAAHEIGHNLGAPHDGVPGSACATTPQTYLMAPSLNSSDQFSPCSLEQMQPVIDAAACIVPISGEDVSISVVTALPPLLLGELVDITFQVRSNASSIASNVTVDFTLPFNLALVGTATSAGSCNDGAGSVNCALGDLAGGTSETVTISARAATTGIDTMLASVSSDGDAKPGNNDASLQVLVSPAVDLVALVPTPVSLRVDQAGTVDIGINNVASIDATDVTITVSLDSGIRLDTASWSAGLCTIAGQRLDCRSVSLAGGATTTLTLGLTAVAVGSQGYSVQVSAAEQDSNPSDNNSNGSVTVVSGDTGGGDGGGGGGNGGGGGSTGWLLVSTLLFLSLRRGSRRPPKTARA